MIPKSIGNELKKIVGKDHYFDEIEDRICYSYDATGVKYKPDVILLPASEEEICRIMVIADKNRIPVSPRGAGTGLSGGSIPIEGGIALALPRMNKIIKIDEKNMAACVEPGVITGEFQAEVERRNFFYPPDPASLAMCTLGGNVAENAGGPRCLKYGVTRDYVLGLDVVLADGSRLKTGGQVMKNVTGYDLTRIIVGSEGTLAVVTGITLKIIPKPETQKTLSAFFRETETAAEAVSQIIAEGILPTAIEFLDAATLDCVREYLGGIVPENAAAMLLIEVDGAEADCERHQEKVKGICERSGAMEINLAKDEKERQELWKARRSASSAMGRISPLKMSEDIVVPRTKLPRMVSSIKEIGEKHGVRMASFGHAGDGNLHVYCLMKDRSPEVMKKTEEAFGELFEEAIKMGGTLSGEHGIGFMKAKFMPLEVSKKGMEIMRGIKKVFDPNNILNPGKIF